MDHKIKYGNHLGIDTSYIPAELGFVLVFPFAVDHQNLPGNKNTNPIVMTFRSDDTKFDELLGNFIKKFDHLKNQKDLCF